MLIGELSIKTGLSRDTIRFYEKQGLIALHAKERRENNYKEYSDHILNRLLTIKHIKGFGFTLNETSELLDMIETNTASCENVSRHIAEKISVIDQKIKELIILKKLMSGILTNCCKPSSEMVNCPSLIPVLKRRIAKGFE